MYTSEHLAAFVCDTRSETLLTQENREAALRCLLDLVGAAAAGYSNNAAVAGHKVAFSQYAMGRSAVWFAGKSLNPIGAAYANAFSATVQDLDDGNRQAKGHPGAAVVPAVLATAMDIDASADELLASIVVGYEVAVRIGSSDVFDGPGIGSGRWCGHGALAAAAYLRNTRRDTLAHAFAIASATSPNLNAAGTIGYSKMTDTDVKEAIPCGTANGLLSLSLAEYGHRGALDVFDYPRFFDVDRILGDLGSRFEILETYFKPYACCRYAHAAIDAFMELTEAENISISDIDLIELHTFSRAAMLKNSVRPSNLVDVQYSIPYCIGIAASLGPSALLPLTEQSLDIEIATQIAKKVTFIVDSEIERRFPNEALARVVLFVGGIRYESRTTTPSGEPSNPMSTSDLEQKFHASADRLLGRKSVSELIAAIHRINSGDTMTLREALSSPALAPI